MSDLQATLVNESTFPNLVSCPADFDSKAGKTHRLLRSLRSNTPVIVRGILKHKQDRRKTGGISAPEPSPTSLDSLEISISDDESGLSVLNERSRNVVLKENAQYGPGLRHLQLLSDGSLRACLILRSTIQNYCIEHFSKRNWRNVETPLLFKTTSEGAREFIVPTRRAGYAYALPQSPQQFKQLLIASGIPRYFQFAKCFRDEDLRKDRQPEFTQLDLECAFDDGKRIRHVIELLIRKLWAEFVYIRVPEQFPIMSYKKAMSEYGSDKPDLRIPIQPFVTIAHLIPGDLINMISNLTRPRVDAMKIRLTCSIEETRKFVQSFFDSAEGRAFHDNPDGGPGIFIYDPSKPLQGLSAFGFEAVEELERICDLEEGDLIVLQARKDEPHHGGSTALGNLRTSMYNAAVSKGLLAPPAWKDCKPLWIVDFPLFSPTQESEPGQGGKAGFASTHHPFTSPKTPEDVDLLSIAPEKAIGDHYDLVINGEEVGGGSRRIHQEGMQSFIFRQVLKMDESKIADFNHLLGALRTGCPPHAGMAIGFDRLVAIIASCKMEKPLSIRDVIAFPKGGKGEDMLFKSPARLSDEEMAVYHLQHRT